MTQPAAGGDAAHEDRATSAGRDVAGRIGDQRSVAVAPTSPLAATTGRGDTSATREMSDTGDSRVDAAIARLADLDERSSEAAVEIYDDVHRTLAGVLGDAAAAARGTASGGSGMSGSAG